jgi:hypothetical protein
MVTRVKSECGIDCGTGLRCFEEGELSLFTDLKTLKKVSFYNWLV